MELAAHAEVPPPVRAARVVDGAGVGVRLLERHPAGREVGRIEAALVRRILVCEQRLAVGRLPDRVVDEQPHARLALQLGGELCVASGQRGGGDRAVGLPQVAHLARLVGRRHAGLIVDLIRRDPGLPSVGEAAVEMLAHALHLVRRQELLHHDEAVSRVGIDLLAGRLHATFYHGGAYRSPPRSMKLERYAVSTPNPVSISIMVAARTPREWARMSPGGEISAVETA